MCILLYIVESAGSNIGNLFTILSTITRQAHRAPSPCDILPAEGPHKGVRKIRRAIIFISFCRSHHLRQGSDPYLCSNTFAGRFLSCTFLMLNQKSLRKSSVSLSKVFLLRIDIILFRSSQRPRWRDASLSILRWDKKNGLGHPRHETVFDL